MDASDTGAGAVLLQKGPDDVLHPVCFSSTKFKKCQKHYSVIEKETLSLLIALEKFNVYLTDTKFPITVYSDHNPVTF